jgi:hypothetical protein
MSDFTVISASLSLRDAFKLGVWASVGVDEAYILSKFNAEKGDIKTRADLGRYIFNCDSCYLTKPADEAVFAIWYEGSTRANSSRKVNLICESCSKKAWL